MSKEPKSQRAPQPQDPLGRIAALEDEVRGLQLALAVFLGEQRLMRDDGKEWLASLKETALGGLAKRKEKQAPKVAAYLTKFFDNIEKGIATFIRRRTTN
ncbi:MAG TPA: hypothetical protein VGO52_06700 [Hyphomonadaceae bacterium]|nr:hypothetical protein [Hyphomonadaceae bacterium]